MASPTPRKAQPTGYSSLRINAFHWAGFLHLVQSPTWNEETQDTMATFSFLLPQTPLWRHHFDISLENIFRSLILYRNGPAHLYDRMHYCFLKGVSLSRAHPPTVYNPPQQRLPSPLPRPHPQDPVCISQRFLWRHLLPAAVKSHALRQHLLPAHLA